MKQYAEGFYKSTAWQQCRASYVKKVNGLCENCLSKGLFVPGIIVHHIRHITPENVNDPGITLNHDNLELLCRDCHAERHGEKRKRYRILPDGRVVIKGTAPVEES